MKNILVTGGAGYIGSHMVYYLLKKNFNVFVLDNFSMADKSRIEKIEEMLGIKVNVIKKDITSNLNNLKFKEKIDSIVHFAAYKSVPESVENPLKYYKNNVCGTLNLIEWALSQGINKIVYSSSSAVYGDSPNIPIVEDEKKDPLSPYAKSKLYTENIFEDTCNLNNLNCVSLRYFNVAGNISSGSFGDNLDTPAIIPVILKSYFEKNKLEIYGDDYNTKDGTPIRDFIHVIDLVEAHFKALEFLESNKGFNVFNIGSEVGYTLLELIKTFENVLDDKVNYSIENRKEGDIAVSIANCNKAKDFLNWKSQKSLEDIFKSMLKFYEKQGFK